CVMRIYEAAADDATLDKLISLSKDWAEENSCYGYRANERSDIEGNRIFLALEGASVAGYLFGKVCPSQSMKSVMPEGTPFFEVEELYVVPQKRSQGIGAALFRFAEDAVKGEAEYIVLSTATKNWRSVLHFYIDEIGMQFWSARLFKKLPRPQRIAKSAG
ncbi:MAG: GNAT family N-acetyltransferase, partial [Clostridia bacterium]|nr:GNAT family N-acetyltransferase [Clostridia bacterium]